jgi:GPH family glycoside/pentoside/hexuronide:cation symporter
VDKQEDFSGSALFERSEIRPGKVPLWVKITQGVGSLPGQHKEWTLTTLLLLYYSQVLGLPATYAAVALAISIAVDAITDPLIGGFSDNYKSKYGRRHPFMFVAILPTGLCVFALFAPPQGLGEQLLVTWLLIFTVTTRVFYTFFALPWNAIAAELSQDYAERTSIITYRMMVGWTGGVAFIFLVYTFVFPSTEAHANGLLDPGRYTIFAWVLATLMVTWMVLTSFATLTQLKYLPQPTALIGRQSLVDLLQRTKQGLRNKNFLLLLCATLIFGGVHGTGQVFDVYMNIYYWEFSTEDIRWFSLVVFGAILSFMTAGILQKRFEKKDIMLTSLGLVTVLAMVKVAARFMDILPANGEQLLLALFIVHGSTMAYFGSMVLIMFASMMADIVDDQELRIGLRQEGVFSAGITFASKATTSLGLIIGGVLLDQVIRFPAEANAHQVAPDVLFRLAFVDGIAIPAFNVFALVLLYGYSLTHESLLDIQAQLRAREGKLGSE